MENGMHRAANRALQDESDCHRLEEARMRAAFNDDDRALIGSSIMFVLATEDRPGRPGGAIKVAGGFVQVVLEYALAFHGNDMFNPHAGLMFDDFAEGRRKLRVIGTASIHENDLLRPTMPGAKSIMRARHIFRKVRLWEGSAWAPTADHEPPDPLWEGKVDLRDYDLPRRSGRRG